MASITRESNGRRTVQFVAADGKRRSIRLGKASQRAAETFKVRVEELLVAKLTGRPVEAETARWLVGLPQTMSDRLANVGLIVPRVAVGTVTLGEHLKNYFAKRTDVKPATATNWKHSRRCLLAFFGDHRLLSSITAGDAADWERWLKTGKARMNRYDERETDEGLAPNTLRKRVSNAKQFFQDAVSRDLIAKNPFGGLKGTVGGNRERDYFVTREVAEKVINACPDLEWRLLFALSRFGGLRCPSEHLALTWGDVNWAEGRMLVRSPKTEHHYGKGTRVAPIFQSCGRIWKLPGTPPSRGRCMSSRDTAPPMRIYERN